MIIESIKAEYNRFKILVDDAVKQVKDEDLNKIIGETENSISILINHVTGNLTSRFTNFRTEDGEKPWRNRDKEFEATGDDRATLTAKWNNAFHLLMAELDRLTDADLMHRVTVKGKELTISDALMRSLAHLSYHVGQILLMARIHVGKNWKSLSIPKKKPGL
jgi:uncharacterized damage-inducible protein DinB